MKTSVLMSIMAGLLLASPAFAETNAFAKWEREIAAFEAADAAKPPPNDAILFVGSSNIPLWKTLEKDFAEFPTIRRGASHDSTVCFKASIVTKMASGRSRSFSMV